MFEAHAQGEPVSIFWMKFITQKLEWYGGNCRILTSTVLADRTNGRAYATTLRPSVVCRSVTLCIAAKRYVLEQKLLLTAYRNFVYQESIDTKMNDIRLYML